MKTRSLLLPLALLTGCAPHSALTEQEQLGHAIFLDDALSDPSGQSCATCHTTGRGYADRDGRPISEGALRGRFGNRNAMTLSYAAFVPPLRYDSTEAAWVGGLFWDGRVRDLEEQAGEPFLNPLEMGARDRAAVVRKARRRPWFRRMTRLYGEEECADSIYNRMTRALAAFERCRLISPFSSKFDAWQQGRAQLTPDEEAGLELFRGRGLCNQCHILDPDPAAGRPLLTDHTYDNLGIPRKPDHPYFRMEACYNPLGERYVDPGLGATVGDSAEWGKFRVPTLRNIALTAPYGHNGYFATLEEIVHFYNVRDVEGSFPPPEYEATVNREELGNLGLTPPEEEQLVCFLRTLTDGYHRK